MKIREYRNKFLEQLTALYGRAEAESFFYLTLEDFRGWKRTDLALNPDALFSDDELAQWEFVVAQLKKEIPVQYILGSAHFFGMQFKVNENVLIPRPETEELVAWILSDMQTSGLANQRILDIGTGSGCIAVSLAKNSKEAEVSAIDISDAALELATTNAAANDVRVKFSRKDILATGDLGQTYDIIVSNPPYVRNSEKSGIKKNVLDNEPHLALFVNDDDALIFYRKIAALAKKDLSENGRLFFEINQYLAKETMDMLETSGFSHLELRKDIYGNDRMVLARK